MSKIKLFRALSSSTRIKILKKLINQEMHLSGLARELGISVLVTSRHIKILEEVKLINKRVFGKTLHFRHLNPLFIRQSLKRKALRLGVFTFFGVALTAWMVAIVSAVGFVYGRLLRFLPKITGKNQYLSQQVISENT